MLFTNKLKKNAFERFALSFALLQVIHLLFIFQNYSIPFPFLYGPIFMIMYNIASSGKIGNRISVMAHFSMFTLFLLWYLFALGNPGVLYYEFYFPLMILSMVCYPLVALVRMRRSVSNTSNRLVLLRQLAFLGNAIGFFIGLLLLSQKWGFELDVNPLYVVAFVMVFSILLLTNYLIFAKDYNTADIEDTRPQKIRTVRDDSRILACAEKLADCMYKDKLFLDTGLTLDDLSKKTALPKSLITDYINQHLQTNYYEWLARFRVEHAKDLLEHERQVLKMEVLANQSGFNSKTTFYRYFKQYVGVSPGTYRENIESSAW
ncbi:helix-turn-helix domain-containing protein [Sphingobacterium olei]|uniref:Helix-turn-helix domain-containing protein n=1 Tax=Sphingobacterium olei TaxID=2571155 RepID=A0A4U0NZ09_9SPHI|nr:helix-turn-helix domain-containing protein [Sphingobacterium olei]TJZ60126.1 helix-turn-helix domain-containing protein [Sphingobacterium olei]